MKITGKTIDGKEVVQGLGKLYYQEGLPLSVAFAACMEYNFVPDWLNLYDELLDNGFSHKRIMHLFNEHISDSYGKEMKNIVLERLNLIYSNENP